VVPRATNRVVDEETLRKWTLIVRTLRSDREYLSATAYEQNLFFANVTEEHRSIHKLIKGNALRKVRAHHFCFLLHLSARPD
jgi:hypothetical protein